jgi:hypothetical protein
MNLLLNQDDIIRCLARRLIIKYLKNQKHEFCWNDLHQYVQQCREEYQRSGLIIINFELVNQLIHKNINAVKNDISAQFKSEFKPVVKWLTENFDNLNFSKEDCVNLVLQDPANNFIKTISGQLTNNPNWITDASQADMTKSFLIRNIQNHENLLVSLMDQQKDFWFIDSGYTNFLLEKRKQWHRLVHNNIHHGNIDIDYPDDRLKLLPTLPRYWRKKGRTILVIESSESYCYMNGTTLKEWRNNIKQEIKKYSDRPIEFRSKESSRKTRSTMYDLLRQSKEYHCIISNSSNAAVEAVWAGVPAITLNRHISNSVTKNQISDINDLYKGDIDPWVRAISYNQFTFDELCNGTALDIIRHYGNI